MVRSVEPESSTMISPLVCLTNSATLANVRGRLPSSLWVMMTMERDWLTRKNYHREAKDEVRRSKYEGQSPQSNFVLRTSYFSCSPFAEAAPAEALLAVVARAGAGRRKARPTELSLRPLRLRQAGCDC